MSGLSWRAQLAVSLLLTAVAIYTINFLVFRDAGFMLKLLLAQLGFLPISVFFVTLVINQLLVRRERLARLKKLNMVVGAFFSEVGNDLLRRLAAFDAHGPELARVMCPDCAWTPQTLAASQSAAASHRPAVDLNRGDLEGLRPFLGERRQFLLRLLENPSVLEHESFSELLWAVFHLAEEVIHRLDLENLSENDRSHLARDVERSYVLLISEWLAYLEYLERTYPYLFSLAVRLNPFDPEAGAAIQ
ncbi:MAG: hypothetical protein FJ128_12710 [Deltaproteobacteria bacterium]|nr:hypothetical protein [Deltaproteobacteria bacterium]